uniref:Uncharacterized protein n=1 Tax=Anguilla anguilla TaxID=7936 RepID=A0A0E9XKG0_ANGAN
MKNFQTGKALPTRTSSDTNTPTTIPATSPAESPETSRETEPMVLLVSGSVTL